MIHVDAYVVSGLMGRQETIAGVHSHRTRCHPGCVDGVHQGSGSVTENVSKQQ